jgi:hypothetical protein
MIRVVKGTLGSGKSYYCVRYLTKYVTYDKLYESLILDYHVLLVTNLDGIKVNHITWEAFASEGLTNQERLQAFLARTGYRKIIVIIDEAQRYFSGMKDPEQFFFFEYSRHYGFDIFLICQSLYGLPKRLVELSEYVVDARSRSQTLTGFQYFLRDPVTGEKVSTQYLRTDKNVFKLYKSFKMDEDKKAKPEKIYLKNIIYITCLVLILGGFGYYYMKNGFHLHPPKMHSQVAGIEKSNVKNKNSIFDKSKEVAKTVIDKNPIIQGFKNDLGGDQKILTMPKNENIKTNSKFSGVAHVGDLTYVIYR